MSRRQAVWLATMLDRERPKAISIEPHMEVDDAELHLRIYEAIDQLPQASRRFRIEISEQLLPDVELRWINVEHEQLKWLNEAFLKRPGRRDQMGQITPLRLEPKDEFILKLDLWKVNRQVKRSFLEKVKEAWSANNQQLRMLRWFDDAEYEKCDLLWAWLYKNKPDLLGDRAPFKLRTQIKEFFKEKDLRPDEINHIINTIKLRWSQRKYREKNNDKKQFNFFISTKADKVLDKLSKIRGLSRSQILELLIHEENDRIRKLKNGNF